jgi:hypothetical protein
VLRRAPEVQKLSHARPNHPFVVGWTKPHREQTCPAGAGWAGKGRCSWVERETSEILPQASRVAVEGRASKPKRFVVLPFSLPVKEQPSRQRAAFPSKSKRFGGELARKFSPLATRPSLHLWPASFVRSLPFKEYPSRNKKRERDLSRSRQVGQSRDLEIGEMTEELAMVSEQIAHGKTERDISS